MDTENTSAFGFLTTRQKVWFGAFILAWLACCLCSMHPGVYLALAVIMLTVSPFIWLKYLNAKHETAPKKKDS